MAYFPNVTAGEHLDKQCADCIHEDPEAGCPLALVQMEFNYSQHNNGQAKLRKCLNLLINEHGDCQMKKLIDKYYKKLPVESLEEPRPKYKPSKLWGKP